MLYVYLIIKRRPSDSLSFLVSCTRQSNMLGFGHVYGDMDGTLEYAVRTKGLYPYLINDDEGGWPLIRQRCGPNCGLALLGGGQ